MNDDTVRVLVSDSPRTRWLFAGMVLVGLALFGFATGVLMAPWAPALGDRLAELTCLQLAFSGERAAALLDTFSDAQRRAIARLLVPGDMVFAVGYGLLLTGLLGLLTLRLPPGWQRPGGWLMWAPLGASAFDGFEGAFLHAIVTAADPAGMGVAPLLGGLAATIKYALLSVVAPAYGIAGSIKGLTVDRKPGALLLYVVVVITVAAIVARPAQQIPACFI